jgi:carbonic anhydrase
MVMDLINGNKRFVSKADRNLLRELSEKGQKPIATVVSCSDSRVPVEVIFDQLEPGKLFVIRVAGNVVAEAGVIGSIEYAVEHLKTPYIIILGHTDCGAVKASLAGTSGGNVGELISHIKIKSKELAQAVRENLELQVKNVLEMPCVKESLGRGELEVYGMLYDLGTGEVSILSDSKGDFSNIPRA